MFLGSWSFSVSQCLYCSDRPAELVRDHLQFLATGHEVLQFLERNLALVEGAERLSTIENREAVADSKGVTDIVGNKNHAEALLLDLMNVLQHHGCLGDTQCGCRLIEDEDLGSEINGP